MRFPDHLNNEVPCMLNGKLGAVIDIFEDEGYGIIFEYDDSNVSETFVGLPEPTVDALKPASDVLYTVLVNGKLYDNVLAVLETEDGRTMFQTSAGYLYVNDAVFYGESDNS